MKTPLLLVIAVILSLGVTSCRKVYFSDGKQVEEYRDIEVQINQSGSFIIIETSWAEEPCLRPKERTPGIPCS
ncbi:MAG: hypothetical protein P8L71_12145 [Flavobacteriales bacterium]|nr:hypothetical protein [Flavobacteriales bacterium]